MSAYKERVHTITFDNGKEFAEHEEMAKKLDAGIYFAHPYASWERGVNENTNGLIRQYFPKARNLTTVTRQEVEQTMTQLNNRPRKNLNIKHHMRYSLTKKTYSLVMLHLKLEFALRIK